ncbi:hypothetical protein AE621_21310 [Acidovorax sp. SD340]|nr:hypothetical protein AE621_21310 [Acidovorax sp. SD340]
MHHVDDVEQDTWIELSKHEIDDRPLAGLAYRCAFLIAGALRRKYDEHRPVVRDDPEGDHAHVLDALPARDDVAVEVEQHLDSSRAFATLCDSVRAAAGGDLDFETLAQEDVARAAAGRVRNQYGSGSKDQAEVFKAVRKRHGLTQAEMAAALGVKKATYISYEHACVQRIPDEVMQRVAAIDAATRHP